jgi:ankyrin repeat protein
MHIARILMERNANSGKPKSHIVAAARFGFVNLFQRFAAIGDDINVEGDNGESLMHAACKSARVDTVQ